MSGFKALDVAISLVLIYTLLSLLCSTINEGISSFLALRARTLEGALKNLLGSKLASEVYNHHLIQGLVQNDLVLKWRRKPSYIPTRTFVLTVLEAVGRAAPGSSTELRRIAGQIADPKEQQQVTELIDKAEAAFQQTGFPKSVDEFRLAVANISNQEIRDALLALVEDAQGDFHKLKDNLGAWFDGSMDRVSGWYRRKVNLILLILGIVVSFGFGLDTIALGQKLWTDDVLRAALVKAAEERVDKAKQTTQPAQDQPGSGGAGAADPESTETDQKTETTGQGNSNSNTEDGAGGAGKKENQLQVDQIRDAILETKGELDDLGILRFPLRWVEEEWLAAELQQKISKLKKDETYPAQKKILEARYAEYPKFKKELAKLKKKDTKYEQKKKALENMYGLESPPNWLSLLGFWLKRHFVGCFLTAVALSLGAPFWFDLLNKLVNIRSAGRRPQKGTEPSAV